MYFNVYTLIGAGVGAVLGLVLVLTIGITRAGDPAVQVPDQQQVAAAAAERQPAGEAGPALDEIVRRYEEQYDARVTEIEFERERGRDVVEIELRDKQGYEWEIEVDANSGELLKEQRERD